MTGAKITDLHRENIDHLTIPSKTGRGQLKRIPEVFDCWFESGSMPYAQNHYPFENKKKFEDSFPANFIAEGKIMTLQCTEVKEFLWLDLFKPLFGDVQF